METYDRISKQTERMNYAMYKSEHDRIDKLMFEAFGGKDWESGLPTVDEYMESSK